MAIWSELVKPGIPAEGPAPRLEARSHPQGQQDAKAAARIAPPATAKPTPKSTVQPDMRSMPRPATGRRSFSWSALVFTLIIFLIALNVGVLLYTAKYAGELRKSQIEIANMQHALDMMAGQLKIQDQSIKKTISEELAAIKVMADQLTEKLGGFENKIRTGLFVSGNSVVLSAPGRVGPQVFVRPGGDLSQTMSADDGLEPVAPEGVSVDDLPKYERTISPEGKLILRKVP